MVKSPLSSFSEEVSRILPYLTRGFFKQKLNIMGLGKITIPQCLVLDLLDLYKLMKMKDIAKYMNISLPAATGLINKLYSLGIVKRVYDKKDRRVIYISLTPKGKNIVKQAGEQKKKLIENLFSKLTNKERLTYLKILQKLKKGVADENIKK